MSDISDITARLAKLKKARDTGVLTVEHGDTRTTFRSLSEIQKIIADLEKELAGLQGKTRPRLRYAYQSGKGL